MQNFNANADVSESCNCDDIYCCVCVRVGAAIHSHRKKSVPLVQQSYQDAMKRYTATNSRTSRGLDSLNEIVDHGYHANRLGPRRGDEIVIPEEENSYLYNSDFPALRQRVVVDQPRRTRTEIAVAPFVPTPLPYIRPRIPGRAVQVNRVSSSDEPLRMYPEVPVEDTSSVESFYSVSSSGQCATLGRHVDGDQGLFMRY